MNEMSLSLFSIADLGALVGCGRVEEGSIRGT